MLYDLCRPVVRVKQPDCSYHTGLNDPTFMSIFIRRSLEGVMIYTTSPPYSRTRHALVFYRSQFFGCVSLVAFLGALCLPLGCTLPVMWVAGSLLAVSNRPAVHLCFYRTGLGPVFWGSAIPTPSWMSPTTLRPVLCTTSGSCPGHVWLPISTQASATHTTSLRRSLAPCSLVTSPAGRLLNPFSYRLFGRSRGVGPFSAVHTGDFPVVIFLHIRNLPTSSLLEVGCRDTGTTCTTTTHMGPFGYRKLGTWLPQTAGSAVCIYAYWSMK